MGKRNRNESLGCAHGMLGPKFHELGIRLPNQFGAGRASNELAASPPTGRCDLQGPGISQPFFGQLQFRQRNFAAMVAGGQGGIDQKAPSLY